MLFLLVCMCVPTPTCLKDQLGGLDPTAKRCIRMVVYVSI